MADEIKTPELVAIEEVAKKVEDFKNKLGEKLTKADLEPINLMIKEMKDTGVTDMKKVNEEMGKLVTKVEEMTESVNVLKDQGSKGGPAKSFGQQVVDAIKAANLLDTPLRKNEHRTLEIKIDKASATMTTANVIPVGTSSIPFSLADYESGLTRIARRQPFLLEIANVSATDKMYVQWAEQTSPDGAANETAEAAAKNKIDFDWTEKSAKVEKITAYIKVSKEALSDLDGLRNDIDTELRETILIKTDTDLMSGDGSTPSLNGLLNQDTAYAAGSFAGGINLANHFDVIRTAIAQVVQNLFRPNYVVLNPVDVAIMDLVKDANGQYVIPPFKSANGQIVSGVQVVENMGQTAGSFTVGDFTKFNVRMREGLTIDIGLDADDFTKNLVTILGEIRLVCYIKANHAGAFVSGTFAAARAALETVS